MPDMKLHPIMHIYSFLPQLPKLAGDEPARLPHIWAAHKGHAS
jgi:hypothetical protein